jgi:methanogenic corrinoid protein MtbC1
VRADIVGISTLMTTTMMAIKKLIPMLKEIDPKTPVIVGGAPLTPQVAQLFGADGYAPDAVSACQVVADLLEKGRS